MRCTDSLPRSSHPDLLRPTAGSAWIRTQPLTRQSPVTGPRLDNATSSLDRPGRFRWSMCGCVEITSTHQGKPAFLWGSSASQHCPSHLQHTPPVDMWQLTPPWQRHPLPHATTTLQNMYSVNPPTHVNIMTAAKQSSGTREAHLMRTGLWRKHARMFFREFGGLGWC